MGGEGNCWLEAGDGRCAARHPSGSVNGARGTRAIASKNRKKSLARALKHQQDQDQPTETQRFPDSTEAALQCFVSTVSGRDLMRGSHE